MSYYKPGWKITDENHLMKEYFFENMRDAFDFIKSVRILTEEEGKKTDIYLTWNKVILYILPNDFSFASKCDLIKE